MSANSSALSSTSHRAYRNLVVLGGSYVGLAAAKELAELADQGQLDAERETDTARYRVIVVEQHSHFGHSFAWPRFAITPGHEHKSFIPYTKSLKLPHQVVHATAIDLQLDPAASNSVKLDRTISIDGRQSDSIPFEACVVATGTRLRPPGNMPGDGSKSAGVAYLQSIQRELEKAQRIVILGGGAVGVQMATDLAAIYNTDNSASRKSITIVQSRPHLMPAFDKQLDQLVRARFDELGVKVVTGHRAIVPEEGFNRQPGTGQIVKLQDGSELEADYVITATGQTPASNLLAKAAPSAIDSNAYIRVSKALQVVPEDVKERNALNERVWALGDVAATGAPKAARPGMAQAKVVAHNIFESIRARGRAVDSSQSCTYQEYFPDPAAIHLTLGVVESVVFRNPAPGADEPWIKHRDDGKLDMGVEGVWERRAPGLVQTETDYWL